MITTMKINPTGLFEPDMTADAAPAWRKTEELHETRTSNGVESVKAL